MMYSFFCEIFLFVVCFLIFLRKSILCDIICSGKEGRGGHHPCHQTKTTPPQLWHHQPKCKEISKFSGLLPMRNFLTNKMWHKSVSPIINIHSFVFIFWDFNSCNVSMYLPSIQQLIDCPTRLDRTIDCCYGNIPEAFKAVCR